MRRLALNGLLVLISVTATVGALEIACRLMPGTELGLMPEAWARRPAELPNAYYWHGALHVHDGQWMRRSRPIEPPRPEVFRIMVIGDSLTYGYGVAAEETYPAVLERELNKSRKVEVLNMGVSGAQSEDVLRILKANIEAVRPEMVVYGICLNDFLAKGQSQRPFGLSVPAALQWSAFAAVLIRHINTAGMQLGLWSSFYDDILAQIDNLYPRFASDLRAMNELMINRGLPPIIAMTLDQQPFSAKGKIISAMAEKAAAEAGMQVVPSADYYARYSDRNMIVSPWEGHPNAEAHRIFAKRLMEPIMRGLRNYPSARSAAPGAAEAAPL